MECRLNPMEPTIRPELPSDHQAIDLIHRQAFAGESEVQLVRKLRTRPDFDSRLSLIAERKGQPLGHILFSPVWLIPSTKSISICSLAPLGVLYEYQRQGVGTALVHAGLEACNVIGFSAVVVLGHPKYYSRFGFKPIREWSIDLPFEAPEDAKMALELTSDSLLGLRGKLQFPPEFDEA